MSFAQLMDAGSQGSFRSVPEYFAESWFFHARRDPSANHCDVANRLSAKDRIDASHNCDVNLKAEVEISGLLEELD
jgi:hypothetical protein